jgi:hypothetical protein
MTTLLLAAAVTIQQHGIEPQKAMEQIAWMKGEWAGKQEFNTDDAPPMVGDATNRIEEAIGGRYLEERLSTTLPGRKPTDTRHMITFDPATQTYRAWWFNDTSVAPTEFEGKIEDGKLVLFSKPRAPQSPRMRATYSKILRFVPSDFSNGKPILTFTLEMDAGGTWTRLFTTTYTKK